MAANDEPPGAGGGMQAWSPGCKRWAGALGAPDEWPQALRTLVGLMRRSGLPTLLAWGPELRLLYNDPFAPVLGAKHPAAFGERIQDVWADTWTAVGPAVQRALAQSSGNVTQAAKLLDISRPTLYDLIRHHNIRA